MDHSAQRNRLMPWYIGLALVMAAILFVAYRMFSTGCQAPLFIEMLVLLVVPAVYLVLMYLTFVSQK